MSLTLTSIKRYNHRIHPCETAQKQELLKHLVALHQDKSILLISDANTMTSEIKDKNMTLSSDAGLLLMPERKWDLLISFDLPDSAELYMTRLSHAKDIALIVDDATQQQKLYTIETFLGKNLTREIIPGFEPKIAVSVFLGKDEKGKAIFSGKKSDRIPRPETASKAGHKKPSPSSKKPWEKKAPSETPKRPRRSITVTSLKPRKESDEEA